MPMMPFRGKFNLSKVLAQTKSAKVESKPPEIPTTTVLREIAVYLDITEKAVYRRMDRLKEKLKKFFVQR